MLVPRTVLATLASSIPPVMLRARRLGIALWSPATTFSGFAFNMLTKVPGIWRRFRNMIVTFLTCVFHKRTSLSSAMETTLDGRLFKNVGALLATALLASACGNSENKPAGKLLINGAGATFPAPIYQKWTSEYEKVDPSVQFNYQAIGSGGGQKQILAGTVDFGASDGPMSDADLATAPGKILHLPTVAGADVATYNLEGNPQLKLDGPTLADIFLGKITMWNDSHIADQNPGVKLPATGIVVVHRQDGSGTTYIWVDYLSSVSKDWESKVGRGTSVSWPTGLGGKGNDGVTGLVKQTPGSIGYVELIYAKENKLPYASIKNAHGEYVAPSIESVTKALASAQIPDDFR